MDGEEVGIHDCQGCVSLCHRREEGKGIVLCGQLAMTRGVGEKVGQICLTAKVGQICLTANVAQSCVTEGGGGERHYTVESNDHWVLALPLRPCIILPP